MEALVDVRHIRDTDPSHVLALSPSTRFSASAAPLPLLVSPSFKYSQSDHDRFEEQGFFIGRSFLTEEGLEYLRSLYVLLLLMQQKRGHGYLSDKQRPRSQRMDHERA